MGLILILGAIAGLAVAMSRRDDKEGGLTQATMLKVKDAKADKLSPDELDTLSDELRTNGLEKAAEAASIKADVKRELSGTAGPAPGTVKPPISGIKPEAWARYVKWSMKGKKDTVTADGHYGYFLLYLRSLVDLGFMVNEKKVTDPKTKKVKYTAEWKPPLTQATFLGDPKLQYVAFGAHAKRLANIIRKSYASVIGTEVEGKPATLSGLMAAMKHAGPTGFASWLKEPAKRKAGTTKAFLEANGIF